MSKSYRSAFISGFLGTAPGWYKKCILAFLILNPVLFLIVGSFAAGWILLLEFIFTLAMALRCYPLQPGGLLALEAVFLGLTSPETVRTEILTNFSVILLLMFMVAGIYFMRDLLMYIFTHILLKIRSKILLSLLFITVSAVLSAFLDALTVIAVIISVGVGFYGVYHRVASGKTIASDDHDTASDHHVGELHREDLDNFRSFLRGLLMHAAVGTALGGVFTLVGEPQNLLIANYAGWNFIEFFLRMVPVSLPVLVMGILTCALLERTGFGDFGVKLPEPVYAILQDYGRNMGKMRTKADSMKLVVQALAAIFLVIALGFHLAEVGLIGLTIIVLQTAFNGVIDEHHIGPAFSEALPFTALLAVFFAITAVIHDQHLFLPIVNYVLTMNPDDQMAALYMVNGLLSIISDNVFVATVYASEFSSALQTGQIGEDTFHKMLIAINTGTNLPSVGTPNGQAAFLFLLTSSLAPLIRLSYGRMVLLALPYTLVLTITGLICILVIY